MFLTEKLAIVMIFKGIALVQFGLAVLMFRGFVFKRIFGKPEYGRYLYGFRQKT